MAGGEKAKSSGEYGEKIVKRLLDLFGWKNCINGVTVPCVYQDTHKKKDAEKSEKHGIDYVFKYKSPLRNATRHDVLISVKCRDGYPKSANGIKSKFKEFLMDIAFASECYPACETAKQKILGANKMVCSSLIFWIDRNRGDGRENESVVDEIGGFYLREECHYNTVALIDNNRAQFLYSAINFAKSKYGENNYKFFYINTGLNNANLNRKYSGEVLPFEYLNSDVLPMAINHNNQNKLLLLVKDKFCKEYLRRLIGLAQEITSDWAANIIIAFPNFNKFEDEETVVSSKADFEDSSFTDKITVVTYYPDFRDEV